jgi:glucokinase
VIRIGVSVRKGTNRPAGGKDCKSNANLRAAAEHGQGGGSLYKNLAATDPPEPFREGVMYLGIEIGGTKLQLGVGPGDGTLAASWRGTVEVAAGAEGIRRQIVAAVPELLARASIDRAHIKGIGIGFGGPVDDATQTIIKSYQIDGWDGFPLAEWIADLLGWPAVLGNDADVAGLAEALFGAGKGLSPIFYITIGSGIGGGLIINGEIYRGCGSGAAEIGHLYVSPNPMLAKLPDYPYTLLPSTLENAASGWAIGRLARAWAAKMGLEPDSELWRLVCGQKDRITAYHVGQAAAHGDRFAQMILNVAWHHLAEALAQVIALLCPRRIVIGGGVSLMGENPLFEPLRNLVAARVFPPFAGCYDIVPAALGEIVVVHGALALARRRWGGATP